MDYARVYVEFITDRRRLTPVVSERHHVLPRALGGGDDADNLIDLSPSDHLFAHMLLAKIYGGTMLFAVNLMLRDAKYRGRRSRVWFALVREQWREVCGKHLRGRAQSSTHLANRAEAMLGNKNTLGYKQSPEHVASRIKSGWKHTPETREVLRQAALARQARIRGE